MYSYETGILIQMRVGNISLRFSEIVNKILALICLGAELNEPRCSFT